MRAVAYASGSMWISNNLASFSKEIYAKKYMRRNKYNAQKTTYKGHVFDSKKEAERAMELDILKRCGEVTNIEYQVSYDLVVNDQKIARYVADFVITNSDGTVTVEDVKGYRNGSAYTIFRLKKKLMKALFDIDIIEV